MYLPASIGATNWTCRVFCWIQVAVGLMTGSGEEASRAGKGSGRHEEETSNWHSSP